MGVFLVALGRTWGNIQWYDFSSEAFEKSYAKFTQKVGGLELYKIPKHWKQFF